MLSNIPFLRTILNKCVDASVGSSGLSVTPNETAKVVSLHFGDLPAFVLKDGADVELRSPRTSHPADTGRLSRAFGRETNVSFGALIGPKAAWATVFSQYGDVQKARTNPPLIIRVAEKGKLNSPEAAVITLRNVVLLQVGTSWEANGMVCLQNMQIVGEWKELRDAVESFVVAQTELLQHDPCHVVEVADTDA